MGNFFYDHKQISYNDTVITNDSLNENEKTWLETMLENNVDKKKIYDQINNATIDREYTDFYLRLKFFVSPEIPKLTWCTRVPVEMRVFPEGCAPVQFLLHCLQGYISELEIFHADSSKIDAGINIENEKVEVILAYMVNNLSTSFFLYF